MPDDYRTVDRRQLLGRQRTDDYPLQPQPTVALDQGALTARLSGAPLTVGSTYVVAVHAVDPALVSDWVASAAITLAAVPVVTSMSFDVDTVVIQYPRPVREPINFSCVTKRAMLCRRRTCAPSRS